MSPPAALSTIHKGTNDLGHALLLKLLTIRLVKMLGEAGSDTDIVDLASVGNKHAAATDSILLDSLNGDAHVLSTSISPLQRYTQSNVANLHCTQEKARRRPEVNAVWADPESVMIALSSREPGDEQIHMLETAVAPERSGPA